MFNRCDASGSKEKNWLFSHFLYFPFLATGLERKETDQERKKVNSGQREREKREDKEASNYGYFSLAFPYSVLPLGDGLSRSAKSLGF